jgi:peptide-N4-(N-acetyl-beta-glucosaminyl)asparagine amidase
VTDVTWRYSNQHDQVLKRRNCCSETELMSSVIALRRKRQENVSEARRKFLARRNLMEQSELMKVREPTKDELKGRSSGSLAWRVGRGETNAIPSKYVFKLSPIEVKERQFNLRFSSAKNRYERFLGSTVLEAADDWKTWEYHSENIFRKVEHDHKMVYLSRTEESENGMVEWRFQFGVSIKSVNVRLDKKTFESGQIRLNFLDSTGKLVDSQEKLKGDNGFGIVVNLSGGNGDCAWQHAQLFRENVNSSEHTFQVSILFD